jgi:alpha-L-fucosidase 2
MSQIPSVQSHRLVFDAPAAAWVEGLPLGNGSLGAMLHGDASTLLASLNLDTLWSGVPPVDHPAGPVRDEDLAAARSHLVAGQPAAAEAIARRWLGRSQQSYQPLADLRLVLPDLDSSPPAAFSRQLDLARAVAEHRFTTRSGVTHTQTALVSHPDRAFFLRHESTAPTDLVLALDCPHPTARASATAQGLALFGTAPAFVARRTLQHIERQGDQTKYPELFHSDGSRRDTTWPILYQDHLGRTGSAFALLLSVDTDGEVTVETPAAPAPARLHIRGASRLSVALAAAAHGHSPPPPDAAAFDAALARHLADHDALYSLCTLDLPAAPRAALAFHFGRYLLIAASRPGSEPVNLQGLWNPHRIAPWGANYTLNINQPMNYWPAHATGLPGLAEPQLRLVRELAASGRETARRMYARPGWVTHHQTTYWRETHPTDSFLEAAFWPLGAAWMSLALLDHRDFGAGDDAWFRDEAWPVLRGACAFLQSWLQPDADGRLSTPLGTSPENHYVAPGGARATLALSPALDRQLIRELFARTLSAAAPLGLDPGFRSALAADLARLAPDTLTPDGRISEWRGDPPEADPRHRHVSHLFALHPGTQITPDATPALAAAAARSLDARGDEGTGWSLAWKLNLRARLRHPERFAALVGRFLTVVPHDTPDRGGIYANYLCSHPPFQIDGNLGFTAALAEALVQSHAGFIDILPCLPAAWPAGSALGLVARPGVRVELAWQDSRLTRLALSGRPGLALRLRLPGEPEPQAVQLDVQGLWRPGPTQLGHHG